MESSNGSGSGCYTGNEINILNLVVLGILLTLALAILIIMSFIQRRNKLCRNCLWGFPGLPAPVDFLVTPHDRMINTVIFGVMATAVIEQIQNISSPENINFYLRLVYRILIVPLLLVLILSLVHFPLFACVRSPRPLLGRVLGLFYSFIWFVSFWVKALVVFVPNFCDPVNNPVDATTVITQVASRVPIIVGAFIVFAWYFYKVTRGCLNLCGIARKKHPDGSAETGQLSALVHEVKYYHILHVKSLLKKPQLTFVTRGTAMKILHQIWMYFFPYSRNFRFPLSFIGAVVAMSMLLYQLTIIIVIVGIDYTATLPAFFERDLAPFLSLATTTFTNHSEFFDGLTDVLSIAFIGLPVLLCISPVVSFIICLFLLIHMVGSVSKELKEIAKKGISEKLPSRNLRVPSAWKYVGYQIGFFVLAYVIYTALVYLVGIVCSVVYLGFRFLLEPTVQIILYILVPVVWAKLIFFSQSWVCKFIFFEDQKGKFIALTNRRLFNWFSFILFFYNGFAGFVGAILRTLLASLFTLLLLFQLDRVVLMKGFERFDFGHKAFLGFVYLDYTYNNAVVHVFINLLRNSVRLNHTSQVSMQNVLSDEEGNTCHRGLSYLKKGNQARNRWLVAYTLLRNPSIRGLTASRLQTAAEKEETEVKILPSSGASIQRTDDDDNIDNAEVYINNDSRLQAAAEVEESEVKMISPISGASIQRTDVDGDGAEVDINNENERPVVRDSRDVVEM